MDFKVGQVIIFVDKAHSAKYVGYEEEIGIVAEIVPIDELPEKYKNIFNNREIVLKALNKPFVTEMREIREGTAYYDTYMPDQLEGRVRLFEGNLETVKLLYNKD